MGEAARSPMPVPVTGRGEPARDAKGLTFGEGRSLLPSICGDEVELEELVEEDFVSVAPSAFAAD